MRPDNRMKPVSRWVDHRSLVMLGALMLSSLSAPEALGEELRRDFHTIQHAPQHANLYLGQGNTPVYAVAFSPNSRLVASAGASEDVRLWDVDTTQLLRTLDHPDAVMAVAFSADGSRLIAASRSSIYVWAVDGELLARLDGHERAVTDIKFSPDGRRIVSSSQDGTARVWHGATYRQLGVVEHAGAVHAVAIHPHGTEFASASEDGTVAIWDMDTYARIESLGHSGPVRAVAFDILGRHLATGASDGVHLWTANLYWYMWPIPDAGSVRALAFFGTKALIVLSSQPDSTARLWDIQDIHEPVDLTPPGLLAVDAAPNDQWAVGSATDGSVLLWQTWAHIDHLRETHRGSDAHVSGGFDGQVLGGGSRSLGQVAIYHENVGWIGQAADDEAAAEIVYGTTAMPVSVVDLDSVADWLWDSIGDGKVDVFLTFGYLPETIYDPGNGQSDGSLIEEFIEDGNMSINTADYIYYITRGGGANGAGGLKAITDSNFDLWTEGNHTTPTADGAKYLPSLPEFTSERSFRRDQIQDDPNWEYVTIFGEGAAGTDPAIIQNVNDGGMVGVIMQTPDDSLPRGAVITELLNNWLPAMSNTSAVAPAGKLATTWGAVKGGHAPGGGRP